MNKFAERVDSIRELMKDNGIGLYYIPMDDCHGSEYVAEHFRCIKYVSGFTGSAGHLIITAEGAWLFVDGRYYVQAASQLEGSGIEMMKWGDPAYPDPEDFVAEKMAEKTKEGLGFGFDGNVVNVAVSKRITGKIASLAGISEADVKLVAGFDLAGEIWEDRPAQEFTKAWLMDQKYVGEETKTRLERVRESIKKTLHGRTGYTYLLSGLDDIAWIFNIRANDIPENPECFAYARITEDEAVLFLGGEAGADVEKDLEAQGVKLAAYSMECLKAEAAGPVLMDFDVMSRSVYDYYEEKKTEIINIKTPSTAMKGVKNEVELACTKDALLRDSAYVTRFMYWLKQKVKEAAPGADLKNDDGSRMSELSVDEKLDEYRTKDSLYIEKSFATIAAYKENGAMMHYQAKPDNFKYLSAEGMLLIDSGVQFKDGTTDITRTFILGDISEEEKKAFTLTAVSTLRLQDVKFISGCRGQNIDIVAREPMWKEGWDYKCGTGHGIGHVLNVHEGPHTVRWKIPEENQSAVLVEGMITSDEPGVYREGRYGIRTENEIVVKKYAETEDGTFLCFEPMTFIPIDLDGIDKTYMSTEDVKLLNDYHKQVYEKLAPFIPEEEKEWLAEYTREI